MLMNSKLKLSKCYERLKDDNHYYFADFLDDDDNKYTYFIGKDEYSRLSNCKKYDLLTLQLKMYQVVHDGKTYYKMYLDKIV